MNKVLTPIEELDRVLSSIKNKKNANSYAIHQRVIIEQGVTEEKISITADKTEKILSKLVKDGFISEIYVPETGSWPTYDITFEGSVFLEQGGYKQQKRKTDAEIARTKIINITIAVTGGIAALYYLFEIARVYVAPVWQHYCHCQFVWQ